MENINIVLAANILKYRKKSGLSQEELANKLGVTFQAVSKWELAKSAPDISFLPTMADVFECSIDDLFSYMPKCKREEFNILPGDSVPEGMKNYLSDQIKYPDEAFVQQAVAQIPWGHTVVLLDKFSDSTVRN